MKQRARSVVHAAAAGAVAGAAGTVAMDLIEYGRYRRGGGTQELIAWETAEGVDKWDDAASPGQFGKWLVERAGGRELPDRSARSVTNVVHWATGIGWGAQFGILNCASRRPRWELALLFGPTVWLASYIVLPVAKVYRPIWEYDAHTLAQDFSVHVAYGSVTAAMFAALMRSTRGR
jgi:hypothetical protein